MHCNRKRRERESQREKERVPEVETCMDLQCTAEKIFSATSVKQGCTVFAAKAAL